jgi:hypothetical protein
VRRLVREEIDATTLRCDLAYTDIGAALSRQTLRIAGRRQDPIEVDLGLLRN